MNSIWRETIARVKGRWPSGLRWAWMYLKERNLKAALRVAWDEFFWYMPYAEWLWHEKCVTPECTNYNPYKDNTCGDCHLAEQMNEYYASIRIYC